IDDLYGPAGGPHSTLLQPWMGYIYNLDGWFSQGFSSIVVPTDDDDVTILFNSVGVGCHLYRNPRDRWVRALVPVVEVHVNTPLNHRDARGLDVFFRDQVNMTGGMHVVFPRSTLGVAMSSPLVGP